VHTQPLHFFSRGDRVAISKAAPAEFRGLIGVLATYRADGLFDIVLDDGRIGGVHPDCLVAAPLRVVVVTSCTARKTVSSPIQLTPSDFVAGPLHLKQREAQLRELLRPAELMYCGSQHRRLMRGVAAFRAAYPTGNPRATLDLYVLSGGYGLIRGATLIAPYDATLNKKGKWERLGWGAALKVPESLRTAFAPSYDLGLLLLGSDYLQACNLHRNSVAGPSEEVTFGGPTLLFCGAAASKTLRHPYRVSRVTVTNETARQFKCESVALKGELAARILEGLTRNLGLARQLTEASDVLGLLKHSLAQAIRHRAGAWAHGSSARPVRHLST
jgi:hypothetical protein